MRWALSIAGCIALLSIAYAVLRFEQASETELHTLVASATSMVDEVSTARAATLDRVDALTALVDRRTDQALNLVDQHLSKGLEDANLGLFSQAWDKHLGEAAGGIAELPGTLKPLVDDIRPVLTDTASAIQTANVMEGKLGPQLFDALSAGRIAAEATATTMRDIQHSVPGVISTVQLIGSNSIKLTDASTQAAQYTAQTMKNLANETTPLPKWFRFVVPAAEIGSSGVAAAAAAGAFNH
jgi:hypothetical protein